jgi:hypothetical protein
LQGGCRGNGPTAGGGLAMALRRSLVGGLSIREDSLKKRVSPRARASLRRST